MSNWAPNHDPRSRNYPARALMPGAEPRTTTLWDDGPVLNQGSDGACVGYAFAGAVAPAMWSDATQLELSERIYAIAKTLDEYPGEAYAGTSVLAGAKAAVALDLAVAYRWCFGVADVVDAIVQLGPVVLGLYWTEGMRAAAGGVMSLDGGPIGGHCTLAVGYDYAVPELGGRPGVMIKNSWGTGWADAGHAWLAVTDLLTLLQRQGEALVVTTA